MRLLRVTIRAVVHFVDWLEYQTEGKPRFHELDPALAEQCRHLSQRL